MERPQAVIQKRSEKNYKNVRSALSREKSREQVTIAVLKAVEFSTAVSMTPLQQREGYGWGWQVWELNRLKEDEKKVLEFW
jgi:hypothetical protein